MKAWATMEDEPIEIAQPESPPCAPPSLGASQPANISRLLHPRNHTGLLTGLTVTIAQPADIADLSTRQLGHYSADGRYQLTLLDAFLLSSLSALTFEPALSLSALLSHCCRHSVGFPARLLTYIRCTARGWVVREGSKLGVDFLLYRQQGGGGGGGAQKSGRQHSVYAVRVVERQQQPNETAAVDGSRASSSHSVRSTSLQPLIAMLRVTQSTKKRLLISKVTLPADVSWEGDAALPALSRCRVELCEVSRWSPAMHD